MEILSDSIKDSEALEIRKKSITVAELKSLHRIEEEESNKNERVKETDLEPVKESDHEEWQIRKTGHETLVESDHEEDNDMVQKENGIVGSDKTNISEKSTKPGDCLTVTQDDDYVTVTKDNDCVTVTQDDDCVTVTQDDDCVTVTQDLLTTIEVGKSNQITDRDSELHDKSYLEYKQVVLMIEDHLITPFDYELPVLPYKETSV